MQLKVAIQPAPGRGVNGTIGRHVFFGKHTAESRSILSVDARAPSSFTSNVILVDWW
jgi:hypothetical protein